ncbi:hypothetical protein Tco_1206636 [Tanacetum coccineum]
MASHASSPLNSLRFPSAAKSRSWVGSSQLTPLCFLVTPSWDELWRRHVYLVTPSLASENIILRDVGVGLKIGHDNQHESDREFIFNEWILDSYDVKEEYAREIGDPYSKRFDKYNRVFNNEIEHLSNDYILRIGKKGYVLDYVWGKFQQIYKKTNEAWHDEAYEEDEMCFICITDHEDEALPLGHLNGARFKAMIRKELEGRSRIMEEMEEVLKNDGEDSDDET